MSITTTLICITVISVGNAIIEQIKTCRGLKEGFDTLDFVQILGNAIIGVIALPFIFQLIQKISIVLNKGVSL